MEEKVDRGCGPEHIWGFLPGGQARGGTPSRNEPQKWGRAHLGFGVFVNQPYRLPAGPLPLHQQGRQSSAFRARQAVSPGHTSTKKMVLRGSGFCSRTQTPSSPKRLLSPDRTSWPIFSFSRFPWPLVGFIQVPCRVTGEALSIWPLSLHYWGCS